MANKHSKILIIRFSSFGDIVQTRSVLKPLLKSGKVDKIDWLVRKDLEGALEGERQISRIIPFDRKDGLMGLMALGLLLRKEKYDLIYDAHNNMRSFVIRHILSLLTGASVLVRSKERWKRFLLFKFRINKFHQPYQAMKSYWAPLKDYFQLSDSLTPLDWPLSLSEKIKQDVAGRIILVPSAAWEMKRWPIGHWKRVIELLPEYNFTILGGPQDDFCEEIARVDSKRVINLAGKLSLKESCTVAGHCDFMITGDTGLQQVADLSGRKGLSLMGPTAFGFVTMGTIKTLGVDLNCRPCTKDGRGKCSQDIYQKCMVEISPEQVASEVRNLYPII